MSIFAGLAGYVLGILSSLISRIYQILFISIRIDEADVLTIFKFLEENKLFKFSFEESLRNPNISDHKPIICSNFYLYKYVPIFFSIREQQFHAGQVPKEYIGYISCFRFNRVKLISAIVNKIYKKTEDRDSINIYLGFYGYFRKTNSLNKVQFIDSIALDNKVNNQLNDIISDFDNNRRQKSGIILYGPPGNGKTSIIKKIACKYDYDVYIPIFTSEMSSVEIVNLFSSLPDEGKIIVVLEDFDSVFNKREPVYNNCKFTLDTFLNILDGLYLNLNNKLVFLTANEVDKVDNALKSRPSRFDYVIPITEPNYHSRMDILKKFNLNGQTQKIAEWTNGQSAAIIKEIGMRASNKTVSEDEVKEIMSSFSI